MLNSTTRVESSQWIIKGVDERHWVVYSMLASLQWWALRWWEMRRQSEQLSMRSMLLSRLLVFFFLLFLLLLLLLLCLSDSLFPYIKYIGPTRRLSSFLWFTSQQQQQQHCGSTTAYRYSLLWCKYINFFFFFFVCHWSVRPAPLNRVDVSLHGFSFSLLSSVHQLFRRYAVIDSAARNQLLLLSYLIVIVIIIIPVLEALAGGGGWGKVNNYIKSSVRQ